MATLGEIATQFQNSTIFYQCANPVLLNTLQVTGPNGKRYPHPQIMKNVIATVMRETALREPGQEYKDRWKRLTDLPISDFNGYKIQQQLDTLNGLWNCVFEAIQPTKLASAMCDGLPVLTGAGPLPSSIRPLANNGQVTRLGPGPEPAAWTKWQVGFRVDGGKGRGGSTRDDLPRVLREGTWPLLKSPDLAATIVGKWFHRIAASSSAKLYWSYQNRDIYNESGTCVARSILGATAYPYRNSQNATDGLDISLGGNLEFQYLFAIDCSGKYGFDTEQKQKDAGNYSLWRPGEKCFLGFDANKILAWTKLVRMGPAAPSGGGWSFNFPEPRWNWVKRPGGELETFLDQELASWTAGERYKISATYDFLEDPG